MIDVDQIFKNANYLLAQTAPYHDLFAARSYERPVAEALVTAIVDAVPAELDDLRRRIEER